MTRPVPIVGGAVLVLALSVGLAGCAGRVGVAPEGGAGLPPGFVDVREVVPDASLDLRYLGPDNFVGEPIDGYLAPRAILTREAAEALAAVQAELRPFGLGVKIFDAYRPQRAVDHFVRWAAEVSDVRTKEAYYPDVDKADLFAEGYIADRSSHSRGSTVDLTLVRLDGSEEGTALDMGTPFDFFGPASWPDDPRIPAPARAHRLLLRALMTKHGFDPYAREWWHFTLRDEPFPDMRFDFPVR